ncbi:metal ABC transporter solute-binding protein, Zn/Mn family [Natribacillus halophilus]|uniref:Zinc-uptake complex component A, substrate-binding n=1 Tax=Natribacillus halophilus TaxID=549003 RepID=A0A1G8REH1_9BACI|nr:zinc ABC transporter substrate-binding protein [Natribacillus halophilus]SDJ15386.1 Zinc-uptake complex component A, substrate-binding [Natribacillus halophilus]
MECGEILHAPCGAGEKPEITSNAYLLLTLGLSPNEEPSQSELAEIVEIAEEKDIGYVVFENNVSSSVTEVIQEEIGAESMVLRNLESISEEDTENNEDYFSIMRKNIETLETALNE